MGTVSESQAGGLLQLPRPAQRPPQAQRLQPASVQVRAAAAGPPLSQNKQGQAKSWPFPARRRGPTARSTTSRGPGAPLWPERVTAGQGGTQAPGAGVSRKRPSPVLRRSLVWPQPCQGAAMRPGQRAFPLGTLQGHDPGSLGRKRLQGGVRGGVRGAALCAPRKGLQEKDKVWLLREQKRKKKLRKLLRRLQNNDTCSMPGLTCFTHDNQHWQTAPLWTREPAGPRAGGPPGGPRDPVPPSL